jgi:hypothetical protein
LVLLLLGHSVANACVPAVKLNVGDKVSDCPRIGLSLDYEKEIRKDLIDAEFNREIMEQQKRIIELKDLQVRQTKENADLWRQEALKEREALDKEKNRSDWKFWGGLIAGVGLTVLAGWAVGQVSR